MALILGLVGEKLAGKDAAGSYLVEHHQAFYIKYSHILNEILEMLNMPISRENEILLGKGLRDNFQRNVLWQAMKKRLEESSQDIKVIGSIRLEDEFKAAKDLGAKMIYITAPAPTRYERFMNRREKTDDGTQSMEEFIHNERGWTEVEIPKLGAMCDYAIENTGSLEELYDKVDTMLEEIKNPGTVLVDELE